MEVGLAKQLPPIPSEDLVVERRGRTWYFGENPFFGQDLPDARWMNEVKDAELNLQWGASAWPHDDEALERGIALANLEWGWLEDLIRAHEEGLSEPNTQEALTVARHRLRAWRRRTDLQLRDAAREGLSAGRAAWHTERYYEHLEAAARDLSEAKQIADRREQLAKSRILNRIAIVATGLSFAAAPATILWFMGNGLAWSTDSTIVTLAWGGVVAVATMQLLRRVEP